MQRPSQHRQVVDGLVDAFDRGRINAVLDHHSHWSACIDRLAHNGVLPGCNATVRVEPSLDRMDVHGPVQPCARVVLTSELQPYGSAAADSLGDVDRGDGEVAPYVGAPAEAATRHERMQL